MSRSTPGYESYHWQARAYNDISSRRLTKINSKEHANFLKALADSLKEHHAVSDKFDVIEEAILVYDQVLQLRPIGHKQHAEAVHDVGNVLLLFCLYHRIDATRARRCLLLLREALHWRPANHPLRDQSLYTLASALFYMNYDQGSGDLTALKECILLHREALQLRPGGHPERYKSLGQLATALHACFNHYGDVTFMVECIDMKREVLRLVQLGHRHRAGALENLASALMHFAVLDGRLEALAEAVSLFRESVALRPPGHPRHFCALDNLANSLHVRYELQDLPSALSESIALRREAYAELPGNHPEWSRVASNLAVSLIKNFRHQPDWSLIDEAITLLRRGVSLLPLGNAVRHTSLGNLADALMVKFSQYKDIECLREAAALYREALTLCPRGHLQRFEFLQSLGHLLTKPGCQSWSEALVLFREAVESCSVGHAGVRPSLVSNMSRCFLDPTSPFFDLPKGISCLSDGYANELSHVNQRLGHAVTDLQEVEAAFTEAAKGADVPTMLDHSRCILDLYTQVIGLLPRAANFGLDHKMRLQVLTGSDKIARNAAARALLVSSVVQAVEILEEGRGIFWSQTLRLRATGFDGIPNSDRAELLGLLRVLEHSARVADNFDHTVTQREEALERRRLLNKKVETVISRIRAYPEFTRFLLPPAFQGLLDGLPDGFVVIVNASQIAHHAMLLHKTTGLTVSLELEAPLKGFDFSALRARLPRDMGAQHERHNELRVRAMRLDSGRVNSFEEVMSQLWTLIVQPVIRKLGLKVSFIVIFW
jgi:tetratricopeptide (TPR) repeat protein